MATALRERTDTERIDGGSEARRDLPKPKRRSRLGRKPLLAVLIVAGAGLAGLAAWTVARAAVSGSALSSGVIRVDRFLWVACHNLGLSDAGCIEREAAPLARWVSVVIES